jgi:hypothetical protein
MHVIGLCHESALAERIKMDVERDREFSVLTTPFLSLFPDSLRHIGFARIKDDP